MTITKRTRPIHDNLAHTTNKCTCNPSRKSFGHVCVSLQFLSELSKPPFNCVLVLFLLLWFPLLYDISVCLLQQLTLSSMTNSSIFCDNCVQFFYTCIYICVHWEQVVKPTSKKFFPYCLLDSAEPVLLGQHKSSTVIFQAAKVPQNVSHKYIED